MEKHVLFSDRWQERMLNNGQPCFSAACVSLTNIDLSFTALFQNVSKSK